MARQDRIRFLGAAAVASVAFLATSAAEPSGPAAEPAERGAAILRPFKQQLQQALRDGLAQGPEQAIGVCRLRAPEIAASVAGEDIRVGRTSDRLRNPANAPEPWMAAILREYQESPDDSSARVVELGEGRVGYAEPIRVQPLCLTCHGKQLSETVERRLIELYPEDRATGYGVGDFRGIFWATFPPSAPSGE